MVGAGGGFLVVPALALLGGLPMPVAVGTSLLVIAMKSAAGFAGYLSSVQIDWSLTLAVTGFAVVGSLAGARLAGRVPAHALSRLFAWFVLAMGTFVLIQQAPAHVAVPVLAAIASLGAGAGVCYGFVARCPLPAARCPLPAARCPLPAAPRRAPHLTLSGPGSGVSAECPTPFRRYVPQGVSPHIRPGAEARAGRPAAGPTRTAGPARAGGPRGALRQRRVPTVRRRRPRFRRG
ncbi:TSUP family transporter [Streptomyces sp. NBC_00286]|uniref:TSUP family transporter n=1 Tax=Streptomyces sp. NBC_00286 TaxID=2975701 RepID=UPI002E28704D|nr:TSUP family transporter [Streptomyces sp. NBC_00286]